MTLTPAKQINFDGTGLADDDDYVTDGSGIGHFHKVKASSSWKFRLTFTGVDTTAVTWAMEVRATYGTDPPTLGTSLATPATITVTADPDGDNTEEVEFSVTSAGTALLQSSGTGISFVYDIRVTEGGDSDIWVFGTGETTAAVTRDD